MRPITRVAAAAGTAALVTAGAAACGSIPARGGRGDAHHARMRYHSPYVLPALPGTKRAIRRGIPPVRADVVAYGNYDGIAPARNSEMIASRIRGAELHGYEGGHGFLFQDPAALPAFIAFLQVPA